MGWKWKIANAAVSNRMIAGGLDRLNDVLAISRLESPRAHDFQARALRIREFLVPSTAANMSLVRVGSLGDGGYVMEETWTSACSGLSIGVGATDEWDFEVASKGIPVYQFDHTVSGPPRIHPQMHFERMGLGSEDSTSRHLIPLRQMMTRLPLGDALMQIDIEGAEWEALADQDLFRFRQIIVELHDLPRRIQDDHWGATMQTLETLEAHHTVVHVHVNNCRDLFVAYGVALPPVVEVTLVRTSDFRDWREVDLGRPTVLDAPNVPGRPQVYLGAIL